MITIFKLKKINYKNIPGDDAMNLVLVGCIILICILLNRFLYKLAIPSLLFFILLGMLLGENGIWGVVFNDYQIAETICSISLILIMFYG